MINNIAALANEAVSAPQQAPETSPTTVKLFVVLHGAYGNLFLSKFATGEMGSNGKDKGVRMAMLVWDAKLRNYAPDVIETAADRLQRENPAFPPNLPQFVQVCEALTPRETYAEKQGWPQLAAPPAPEPIKVGFAEQQDGKDWARSILARHDAGDVLRPIQVQFAKRALGIPV